MTRMLTCVAFLATVLLLAACDSGSASPVASPSETPPPATASSVPPERGINPGAPACPATAEVCTLAQALRAEEIVRLVRAQEITCPAPPSQGAGGPYPLCDGAASAEKRTRYTLYAFQSEAVTLTAAGLTEELSRYLLAPLATGGDQYGPATSTLYSVGCPATGGCAELAVIIFSQIPAEGTRRNLVFVVDQRRSTSQASEIVTGPLLDSAALDAALKGGAASLFTPGFSAPIRYTFTAWKAGG